MLNEYNRYRTRSIIKFNDIFTLFTNLILFNFTFIFFNFVIVHMSKWILSVICFINYRIILLITFDNTFWSCTNNDNRFRCWDMRILSERKNNVSICFFFSNGTTFYFQLWNIVPRGIIENLRLVTSWDFFIETIFFDLNSRQLYWCRKAKKYKLVFDDVSILLYWRCSEQIDVLFRS